MATSYPGALDDFTNPTSGDTLDSPSHSAQHANANDAVEAVEAKLGIGASPAGSAVSGYVLLAQGGGTTTWSSVADTNAVVLTAGGSTVLSTDADIEPLILQGGTPEIATVGSVSANGTTITYTASNTFSAGQAVRITGVNPAQFNFDRAVLATAGTGDFTVTNAGTGTYVSGGTAILYQGNLQEWKDYEGNVVASVDQFGKSNLGGLVHINTTSFSAVASQSINDVFSADYKNYKIIVSLTASASIAIRARLRVGGTDNSTASSYASQEIRGDSSTASAFRTIDSFFQWSYAVNGSPAMFEVTLINPFEAVATAFNSLGGRGNRVASVTGNHDQTVSYTGFTIIAESGNITGTARIYGIKD